MERHIASAPGAFREEDALVLKERLDARDLPGFVLARLQLALLKQHKVSHYRSSLPRTYSLGVPKERDSLGVPKEREIEVAVGCCRGALAYRPGPERHYASPVDIATPRTNPA
jgi:hypothetical protein